MGTGSVRHNISKDLSARSLMTLAGSTRITYSIIDWPENAYLTNIIAIYSTALSWDSCLQNSLYPNYNEPDNRD